MPPSQPELKRKIIVAGAGAGKTRSLTHTLMEKVQSYYRKKGHFPRVAVSTFTRKATAELRERLMLKALEQKNNALTEYISQSPLLGINTLHGILNQFLKTRGWRLGLSPGFTLMDTHQADRLFREVLKDTLFKSRDYSLLLHHYSFEELVPLTHSYLYHLQNHSLHTSQPSSPGGEKGTAQEGENTLPAPTDQDLKAAFEKAREAILQDTGKTEKERHKKVEQITLQEKSYMACRKNLSVVFSRWGGAVLKAWVLKQTEHSVLSYNDLEYMSLEILRRFPEDRPRWDFWFLDEYQDTSFIQKEILDHLTRGSFVFIVGDPQQSIYRFRGADSEVFKQTLSQALKLPDCRIQRLQTNFRATKELIAFFNDIFKDTEFEKILPPPDAPPSREGQTTAHIILLPPPGKSRPQAFEPGQDPQHLEVFYRLKHLFSLGVKASDIAILARKNKTLHKLALYLKTRHIPIYQHGSGKFLDKREIKDMGFLLKFLLNPHHNENLIGLLRVPYWRMADQMLVDGMGNRGENSLWDFYLTSQRDHPVIRKLKQYQEQARKGGYVAAFQNAARECGILDLSYLQDPTGLREANLWKMLYQVGQMRAELAGFCESLGRDRGFEEDTVFQEEGASTESTGAVQLMTIHQAKGLEFDHVVLVDCGGRFAHPGGLKFFTGDRATGKWSLKARREEDHKRVGPQFYEQTLKQEQERLNQELRRLFYVALTRARRSVTLVGIHQKNSKTPSWINSFPFFKNISPGSVTTPHYTCRVQTSPSSSSAGVTFPSKEGDPGVEPKKGTEGPCHPTPSLQPGVFKEARQGDKMAGRLQAGGGFSHRGNVLQVHFSTQDLLPSTEGQTAASPPKSVLHTVNQLKAGVRGKEMHQAMEQGFYAGFFPPQKAASGEEDSDSSFARYFSNPTEGQKGLIPSALRYLQSMKDIPFRELIQTGRVEWPFRWQVKPQCFFNGRVDLWGQTTTDTGQVLWVVDYKTGSTKDKEKHFQQLGFYALVFQKLFPHVPIKRVLVYLLKEQCLVRDTTEGDFQNAYRVINSYLSGISRAGQS